MSLELCVVGSVALDTVETAKGKRVEVLGGSASFVCTAASYFIPRSRLVAVVGTDFPRAHLDEMQRRGVDMAGLETADGRTFRWVGRYAPDFSSRESLDTQLNVFAGFQPKLPESYRDAELVFLGNIDPVLQLDVLSQVKKPKLVALDTMNFWIGGKLPELKRVLAKVDVLLLNDEEARQLSGEHNLGRAVGRIRELGPRLIVIKRGEHGAILYHEGGIFAAPAFPIHEVVDPTGAGDTFAGGFMGYLAMMGKFDPEHVRRAMVYGTVMASYCVEDFSLDRLHKLSQEEIEARFLEFRELVRF